MYMKDKPEGFKVQPRNNNSSLKAILKNISTKEKGTSHKHTSLHTSTPNISYISDTDIPSTTEAMLCRLKLMFNMKGNGAKIQFQIFIALTA